MLLDTSGLLCLHHRPEPFHEQARILYQEARVRLTHNYILAEFVALATARHLPRVSALTYLADLLENPDIETVWIDAVSFILMRHRRISEALTTDRHFEQEGFQRLLADTARGRAPKE